MCWGLLRCGETTDHRYRITTVAYHYDDGEYRWAIPSLVVSDAPEEYHECVGDTYARFKEAWPLLEPTVLFVLVWLREDTKDNVRRLLAEAIREMLDIKNGNATNYTLVNGVPMYAGGTKGVGGR